MQNPRSWFMLAVFAATPWSAAPAAAQVFTPTFLAPDSSSDAGIYASDGGIGDVAVEGIWRRNRAGYGLALRAGGADTGDGLVLSVGGQLRGPVVLAANRLAFALTAGAQGVFGAVSGAGAQIGVSSGRSFSVGRVTVTPYAHPRLTAVAVAGKRHETDDEDNTGLRFGVGSDFGVNLNVYPGLTLRFATGIGNGAGLGIGVALRR